MFSNNQLKDLIEGKVIGTTFPYDTNDEQEIEAHIIVMDTDGTVYKEAK